MTGPKFKPKSNMKRDYYNVPGIKSIGWIYSWELPRRIDLKAIVGEEITLLSRVRELPFSGVAECRHTREKENHKYSELCELSFRSPVAPQLPTSAAIVITTIGGATYVIGSREEPAPTRSWERSTGTPEGTPASYDVKVAHRALRTMIKVNIMLG